MSKGSSAKRRAAVRRRRTMLALLAVILAAAVALFVWRPWEGADAPPTPAPSESPAPAPSTGGETPSQTPEPTSTEPFTPIGGDPTTAAGEPCVPGQVRLTPQTDHDTYADGELVQISFTIENTGEAACSLNAGTGAQEYEIRTGDELVYRWSDCAADVQDDVVTLEPDAPQSTVPIEWDRTRSSSDTCTAEREQVTADGAAYNLSVRVGDFSSQQSKQFILE